MPLILLIALILCACNTTSVTAPLTTTDAAVVDASEAPDAALTFTDEDAAVINDIPVRCRPLPPPTPALSGEPFDFSGYSPASGARVGDRITLITDLSESDRRACAAGADCAVFNYGTNIVHSWYPNIEIEVVEGVGCSAMSIRVGSVTDWGPRYTVTE